MKHTSSNVKTILDVRLPSSHVIIAKLFLLNYYRYSLACTNNNFHSISAPLVVSQMPQTMSLQWTAPESGKWSQSIIEEVVAKLSDFNHQKIKSYKYNWKFLTQTKGYSDPWWTINSMASLFKRFGNIIVTVFKENYDSCSEFVINILLLYFELFCSLGLGKWPADEREINVAIRGICVFATACNSQ